MLVNQKIFFTKTTFALFLTLLLLLLTLNVWTFLIPSRESASISIESKHEPKVVSDTFPDTKTLSDPSIKSTPPDPQTTLKCTDPPLKVTYLNGHGGTFADFSYLSQQLGFNFSQYNPDLLKGDSTNDDGARDLNNMKLGDFFCSSFDIVVVGDINPQGRFLLQRIDESPDLDTSEEENNYRQLKPCGIRKLVMQSTNRFDWGVGDRNTEDGFKYVELIKRLAKRKDTKVVWVANNPWEPHHAAWRQGGKFANYTVIRPFGYTLAEVVPYPPEEQKLPAIIDHSFVRGFRQYLDKHDIKYKLLSDTRYGGPKTIAQFKVLITAPYQTSTMKNLANGVVTYVPSPRYLKEYFMRDDTPDFVLFLLNDTFEVGGDEWYKYIEYYCDELKDYFYTFDSPEELKTMLNSDNPDPRNLKEKGIKLWEQMRLKSLADWKKVLGIKNKQ